jgi:hypothetical protein
MNHPIRAGQEVLKGTLSQLVGMRFIPSICDDREDRCNWPKTRKLFGPLRQARAQKIVYQSRLDFSWQRMIVCIIVSNIEGSP